MQTSLRLLTSSLGDVLLLATEPILGDEAGSAPVFDISRTDQIVMDGNLEDWGDNGFRVDLLMPLRRELMPVADHDPRIRLAWNGQGLRSLANGRFAPGVQPETKTPAGPTLGAGSRPRYPGNQTGIHDEPFVGSYLHPTEESRILYRRLRRGKSGQTCRRPRGRTRHPARWMISKRRVCADRSTQWVYVRSAHVRQRLKKNGGDLLWSPANR